MKIPNKQDFQNFMNLYKKCTEKPYYFFVINATFASDNLLRLRINISKKISKLTMTIDDKNRDEKSQCDINREAAEISVLLSGKIDRHEHLTSKNILSFNQKHIRETS